MLRAWGLFDSLPGLRRLLLHVVATVAILAIGGLLFAWSGIYNVSASSGHLAITRALLKFGLHSSVRTHSFGLEAPPLGDPDLVRLGAGHFAGGCAPCHGAPGEPANPITDRMVPPPPGLSHSVGDWETEELFWIVKHGLKYTAMPAWPSLQRDDEVWAVVAFLERLPDLSPQGYRTLANFEAADVTSAEPEDRTSFTETIAACARCHGDENSPVASRLVPKLGGQSVAYMEAALRDYAIGMRFSGIMKPVAAELDEAAISRLSEHYAALDVPHREAPDERHASAEQIAKGRQIATQGVPSEWVPPCLACHGANANAVFPRLSGQHAPYLLQQLRLFKQGRRGLTATSEIMEPIAARLTDDQMQAVAAYFARRSGRSQEPAGEQSAALEGRR